MNFRFAFSCQQQFICKRFDQRAVGEFVSPGFTDVLGAEHHHQNRQAERRRVRERHDDRVGDVCPTGRLAVLCHGQLPSLFHSPEHLKASAPSLTSGNGGLPRFLGKNVVGSFEAFVSGPEDLEARVVDPRSELEKSECLFSSLRGVKPRKWFPLTPFRSETQAVISLSPHTQSRALESPSRSAVPPR
jgi:hypothetical protein